MSASAEDAEQKDGTWFPRGTWETPSQLCTAESWVYFLPQKEVNITLA